jgi:hypothetical protein
VVNQVNFKRLRKIAWGMCLTVVLTVLGLPFANALTNEELRRYGFGNTLTDAMTDMNEVQVPRPVFRDGSIPSPQLPSMTETYIPESPVLEQRVFRQGGDVKVTRVEGQIPEQSTSDAVSVEHTFREIKNYFAKPEFIHNPVLSLNYRGVTGLWNTSTARVQRKGSTWLRIGAGYDYYDQSGGVKLPANERIEKYHVPITYMTVPVENLETSLQLVLASEEGHEFPIPSLESWKTEGIDRVQIMAKYRFLNNEKDDLSAAFGLGLRVAVEENMVTRTGSNGVDYETFVALTKGIKNFSVTVEGGFIFTNGENYSASGVPDLNYGNFGLEFRPSSRLDVGIEANYMNWNNSGSSLETTLGAKYSLSRAWTADLSTTFENTNEMVIGRGYRAMASLMVKL